MAGSQDFIISFPISLFLAGIAGVSPAPCSRDGCVPKVFFNAIKLRFLVWVLIYFFLGGPKGYSRGFNPRNEIITEKALKGRKNI